MGYEERDQLKIRLPPDQMRRLTQAAKQRNQSKQTFVYEAVMAEVAIVEEYRDLKKRLPGSETFGARRQKSDAEHGLGHSTSHAGGFGISERLQKKPVASEEEAFAPQSAAPVVVNVGNQSAAASNGSTSDIDRLAAYVVNGDEFGRDMRLRTAVSILHASTPTDEERKVLAARLDEAVAAKSKTASSDGESVLRAARVTFDKLAGYWKGNG